MNQGQPQRPRWVRVMLVVAAVYAIVGIVFAIPTTHVRAWRLAAWAVSAVAYGAHVAYERIRLRNPHVTVAWHVALASALGALALAVGAIVHSLSVHSTPQHQRLLLVALVAWPIVTGVPAFLVGLAASAVFGALARRQGAE